MPAASASARPRALDARAGTEQEAAAARRPRSVGERAAQAPRTPSTSADGITEHGQPAAASEREPAALERLGGDVEQRAEPGRASAPSAGARAPAPPVDQREPGVAAGQADRSGVDAGGRARPGSSSPQPPRAGQLEGSEAAARTAASSSVDGRRRRARRARPAAACRRRPAAGARSARRRAPAPASGCGGRRARAGTGAGRRRRPPRAPRRPRRVGELGAEPRPAQPAHRLGARQHEQLLLGVGADGLRHVRGRAGRGRAATAARACAPAAGEAGDDPHARRRPPCSGDSGPLTSRRDARERVIDLGAREPQPSARTSIVASSGSSSITRSACSTALEPAPRGR